MLSPSYTLRPIGWVINDASGCTLDIDEPFRPALTEVAGFSHLLVLWWCHQLDSPELRSITVVEKPYAAGPEVVGVFATRSPVRPNPIAITPVALSSVDIGAGKVAVPYIDAEHGSPILDIKPYHPSVDRIRHVSTPAWCADWPQWLEDSATFDWGSVFANAQ